jgi:hypothetical protein
MFLSWRWIGAAVLPVAFGLGGCQSAETCECAEAGIILRMSPRLFEHLDAVGFVGPGCASLIAPMKLASNDGIRLIATAAGTCHVKVLFKGGAPTFEKDVDVMSAGCCGGYAAAASVPDFDGGFDDGGAADGAVDAEGLEGSGGEAGEMDAAAGDGEAGDGAETDAGDAGSDTSVGGDAGADGPSNPDSDVADGAPDAGASDGGEG